MVNIYTHTLGDRWIFWVSLVTAVLDDFNASILEGVKDSKLFLLIIWMVKKLTSNMNVYDFNWNHFEIKLLNLRINFYLLRTFCPHLGSFCVVSSFTTFRPNFTSGLLQLIFLRPRIGMLITGDTVTKLSIPIRGCGKISWRRPEVKFGRNVVKEETIQKLPRWGQKVRNK